MKKKALVIRFSSIGDIILTTPAIRCLSLQGKYEIDFLTHERFSHVIKDNPYLNQIISYKGDLIQLIRQIRNEKYDVIIDLHKSTRSYLLRMLLSQKVYGFKKLRIKRWWRTKTDRRLKPDKHISLRFVDALSPLGITYDDKGLDFSIPVEEKIEIKLNKYDHQIGLITGANYFTKTIPTEISKKIIEQNPTFQFHILGGQKEITNTKPLNTFNNVVNHCGKRTLAESASIIDQCDLIITTDTSLMHIAAARNKKIIAIFGGTVKEFGFYPLLPKGGYNYMIVENNNLECRPCSKSGRHNCPKDHFKCMKEISTKQIQVQIKKQLISNHL